MQVFKISDFRRPKGKDIISSDDFEEKEKTIPIGELVDKKLPYSNLQPLCINIFLAQQFGIKESVILTFLDYMVKYHGIHAEEEQWIRLSYDEWAYELGGLWSVQTVARTLSDLRDLRLIIAHNINKNKHDKTLSYRINYENKLLKPDN